MNQTDPLEEQKFQLNLSDFLSSKDIEAPSSEAINAFQLYKTICRRGGYQSVTNRKEWLTIYDELGIEKENEDEEKESLRMFYVKYLSAYERKNYFGIDEDEEEDLIVEGNPRKMNKTNSGAAAATTNKEVKNREDNVSLESEIAKTIEEEQKEEKDILYLNKNKLTHSKIENKRIILGFESSIDTKGVIYSLNMLMLYSVNIHFPFLFENNEKIFSALSSYTHSIYPPRSEKDREHLRTIISILRNLTMNPTNLKYILSTPIFALLIKIFNTKLDQECSKNIIDVMNGLVKVGWDCGEILKEMEDAVIDDRLEEVEGGLDLLRGLMDERDEGMINGVKERVGVFIKILISPEMSIEIKEQTLEILSFVSDINAEARLSFSKNSQLLSILLSILQHMRHQEKLSQFAALTLSNISTTPGARYELSFFESELMLIGFTDDSLAGIIANILADVANA